MEYCGFSINVKKQQSFCEVPIRSPDEDIGYSRLPARSSGKQALSTQVSLDVSINGYRVTDHAFLFELRAILELFINKRLGEQKQGYALNYASEIFGTGYGGIHIERHDSRLVINYIADHSACPLVTLNVIHAKTLHAILHKALQVADFQ